MENDAPILEVKQSFSKGAKKLNVFRNRVETWKISTTGSEEKTNSILLSEVTQVSLKPRFFLWRDLLVISNSATLRMYPLPQTDAEHARDLIESEMRRDSTKP